MEQFTQSPPAEQSPSSFMVRAVNVFSSPSELFTEVSSLNVQTSSWLIPYLVSMVIALIFTFALFNNQNLREEIFDTQRVEMQKNVAEGKMTQEQADRITEGMESASPLMFILFGSVPAMLIVTIALFGISFILWLASKLVLKFTGSYKKILEVYGLSSMIGIVGAIVTLVLMNAFDTMKATPGGSLLLLGSFDRHNFGHNMIASLNVFTLWQAGIVGLGLAKVSNKSTGTGMGISYGLWLVWALIASSLGWVIR